MANNSHSHIIERVTRVETQIDNLAADVKFIEENHLPTIERKIDRLATWSAGIILTLLLGFGSMIVMLLK